MVPFISIITKASRVLLYIDLFTLVTQECDVPTNFQCWVGQIREWILLQWQCYPTRWTVGIISSIISWTNWTEIYTSDSLVLSLARESILLLHIFNIDIMNPKVLGQVWLQQDSPNSKASPRLQYKSGCDQCMYTYCVQSITYILFTESTKKLLLVN